MSSSSSSMNDDAKEMPVANDDANNNNNNMMMRMDSHDEIERNRSLRQDDDDEVEPVVLHDSTLYTQNNVTDNESSSLWNNQEEDMVASTAALFLTLTHNNNNKEEHVDTEHSMLVLHNKDDSCCVGKTSLRERLQKSLLVDRRQSPQNTRETESSENDSSCWTGDEDEDGSNSSGILLSDPKEDISAAAEEEDPKTHVDSFTNPVKDTICQAYAQYAASAETLETTIKPKTNLVKLHIYDLIASETVMQVPWVGCHFPIGKCFSAVNNGLHALGTGAYHCGIEVNGIEYAFGANEVEGLSGVFTCIPKHSPGYEYRTTLDFGHLQTMKRTWIKVPKVEIVEIPLEQQQPQEDNNETLPAPPPAIEVHASSVYRQHSTFCHGHAVMRQMAREYMGRHYDLLTKNCCTFARDACLRLGVSQDDIPTWFLNLAETGRVTKKMAENSFKPFSSCQEQAAGATSSTEPLSSRKSLALAAVEMPCMDRGFEVVGNDMEELRVIDVDHGSPAWRQR